MRNKPILIILLFKIIFLPNKINKGELVENHKKYIRKELFRSIITASLSLVLGFCIFIIIKYFSIQFDNIAIIIIQIIGAFFLLCGSIFKKMTVVTDSGKSNFNSLQSLFVQAFFFCGTSFLFLSLLIIIYQYNL